MAGKLQRGVHIGPRASLLPVGPSDDHVVTVSAVKCNAAILTGELAGKIMEMMIDSGSAVSLVTKQEVDMLKHDRLLNAPVPKLRLVTASGEPMLITGCIQAPVRISQLEITHQFLVVERLVTPVILGVDFLQQHNLVLNFASSPVAISNPTQLVEQTSEAIPTALQPIIAAESHLKSKICAVAAVEDQGDDPVDHCSIPDFQDTINCELPKCIPALKLLLEQHKHLFVLSPGKVEGTYHYIPTAGSPVKVPPRRIPAHYKEEVEKQIQHMSDNHIIEESTSPWMAPAVFVKKKTGEIRLCVDYRELNKKTTRDAYPLPLPDEVQDCLAGSSIFSTLDLQSGYWQIPEHPRDREKTAFSPGPGMGLFQFCRMPFGLSGAPGSFQRFMDKILRGLSYVTIYLDDILVHPADEETHKAHLMEVFDRLATAGVTLWGKKCRIGMTSVAYLGHVFSAKGMAPDPNKIQAVQEWPAPSTIAGVRQFLGLASYYRHYIECFSHIAAPLHALTQKNATFCWTEACQQAFTTLKERLIQPPVLQYPQFHSMASQFVVYTDASDVGLGAVLEQDNYVIAYASRILSKSEWNYSVIQKECLAIVYATKQFRHYLLGRQFQLCTDHAPLQWLSAQRMEGLLCRWALTLQEYSFTIVYRKGVLNGNADSLSRCENVSTAATFCSIGIPLHTLQEAQRNDPVTSTVYNHLSVSREKPTDKKWSKQPLCRYAQLWSQLLLLDGIVCRCYCPGPDSELITVPVLPCTLQQAALHQAHNAPGAGHQGQEKTLQRLRLDTYWVGMASDVNKHCQNCTLCQQAKLSSPPKAPLVSLPVGRPWEMLAIDVLEVPISTRGNCYLLVVQDYFTKWAEAFPMPDQTAKRITDILIGLCAAMGLPRIIHSDQGRNFESAILHQTLQAFGVTKSHTSAYHPQGDGMVERLNRSILQMLRTYVTKETDWEQYLPLIMYAYRTTVHSSTQVSPFRLMFGRQPQFNSFPGHDVSDPTSYQKELQAKLAKLQDILETNIVQAASSQKSGYDYGSHIRTFEVNDPVWLLVPRQGKLASKWQGGWKVKALKSTVNLEICNKKGHCKVVHITVFNHQTFQIQLTGPLLM